MVGRSFTLGVESLGQVVIGTQETKEMKNKATDSGKNLYLKEMQS